MNVFENFAVNSNGTNYIVNFAENYFERFCVTLCEGAYHMSWSLE